MPSRGVILVPSLSGHFDYFSDGGLRKGRRCASRWPGGRFVLKIK